MKTAEQIKGAIRNISKATNSKYFLWSLLLVFYNKTKNIYLIIGDQGQNISKVKKNVYRINLLYFFMFFLL